VSNFSIVRQYKFYFEDWVCITVSTTKILYAANVLNKTNIVSKKYIFRQNVTQWFGQL